MTLRIQNSLLIGLLLAAGGVAAMAAGAGLVADPTHSSGKDGCEPARWSGAFSSSAAETSKEASSAQNAGERKASGQMAQGMMMGPGHGRGMGMMERRRGMGRDGMGRMGRGNPVRHRYVMMNGLPAPYARMTNPLKADAQTLAKGKALFLDNCASCHGETARGDGEAGKELNPRPADLAFIIDKPIASDGFLMWSISEGGEALKTDMPAFKEVLSETERWQIITWLRHGLKR